MQFRMNKIIPISERKGTVVGWSRYHRTNVVWSNNKPEHSSEELVDHVDILWLFEKGERETVRCNQFSGAVNEHIMQKMVMENEIVKIIRKEYFEVTDSGGRKHCWEYVVEGV